MGDISIIARRLTDGHVQYGWSGNGGYFSYVGERLLVWYDDPEIVEYLFGLGQLGHLGKPGSEKGGEKWIHSHELTGTPHNLGTTEREIFSKIAFIDHGYFYDLDKQWYYVDPGPFRIKLPLEFLWNYLEENKTEGQFECLQNIEKKLISFIFNEYSCEDQDFSKLLQENNIDDKDVTQLIESKFPISGLYDDYRSVYNYFDDWVVVTVDDTCSEVTGFKVKKKTNTHIETIEW